MAKRKIIEIEEDKCTGCGACVTKCAEGALRIVDGKAKVVNEVFCDGLGACIGECPEGALKIVEREAPDFDEHQVKKHMAAPEEPCGCPSHTPVMLGPGRAKATARSSGQAHDSLPPELMNWPIQWRLVSPQMPFFKGNDVLLAADCVPFTFRDFHGRFLKGRPVIIGCPKLDDKDAYLDKLTKVLSEATPKSLTLVHMEVPCCFGLARIVEEAVKRSGKRIPVATTVVSIKGDILSEG